ncbi:uncharacterized protein DNG_00779 [Cephalotrichum gorgonifer]|uniref:Kinetochore protein mis13 n=1 Tax=Cephalotrichum gorgonifer TaxID=2041049 RepID=A0AAE8MPW5_9PEZI|nr:uncharacterized protein DNG_00779 [Cephalotrichum gorgonifer]
MTTVLQTRQPLQILSMSNQERRKSKRLAAQYDEQDGDFTFARASKRTKTTLSIEEAVEPAPRTKAASKTSKARTVVAEEATGAKRKSGRRRKASVEVEDEPVPAPAPAVAPKRATRRSTRRTSTEETRPNGNPRAEEPAAGTSATPVPAPAPILDSDGAERVALPLSDTPVINRNKEMRKKGGGGNRRSSLGSRGRRASSLIEMGHTALPHKEVRAAEFYKHVEEGLPEPRRMRQLLTWCGERALSEKPRLGAVDSGAILGARAIQDQLLKDFQAKSEFSNWFDREENRMAAPVSKQPNPRNIEHERKIQQLEEKIKRLREQKKMWQSLKRIRLNPEPLFPDDADPSHLPLPNEALLDPAEQKILHALTGDDTSFTAIRSRTVSRLKAVEATLGLRVDTFADHVHKLEQRVATAAREADRVLSLGAVRLREREVKEKRAAGTREVPIMEVMRSLGRILPEGDG